MEKKISIVTIAMNCVDDLAKTIQSVKSQTVFSDCEQIVIDGGSTDGTVSYLESQSTWLSFVSEKDGGIYNAMNKGVDRASTDFVVFLNAGDVFCGAKVLEGLLNQAEESPCYDIYYGDAVRKVGDKTVGSFKAGDVRSIWKMMPFCHQATLCRARIFKELKFDERLSIASDFKLFFQAHKMGFKFKRLDILVAEIDNQGVSNTEKVLSTTERFSIVYKDRKNTTVFFYYMYRIVRSFVSEKMSFLRL